MDVVCRPEFTHLELDGEQKSAMRLVVMAVQRTQ
jgi:stage V sporulation protein SpoVS